MPEARTERYYVELGRSHDYLLRCKNCQRLVLYSDLTIDGSCRCGSKHTTEITTLSLWEWLRIRLGLLRFPDMDKFLGEFSRARK